MTKVPLAIDELHRSENELVAELLRISDRHSADHEVHHVARDLCRWSREHVRGLARVGARHGLELDPETEEESSVLARLRRRGSEVMGRSHAPAMLLLRDMRALYLQASGVSVDWEILAQTAQALEDQELLELAEACHPQTLRQMKWANAILKESAAQVMVTP